MRPALAAGILILLAGSAFAQDQQLGARTKAMGGSYTAFEDDPVSIWLNPAGIATQPDQLSVVYQSYTGYEVDTTSDPNTARAETLWVEPAIAPSYVGMVFQLGTPEEPMAVGICYARPYHLKYVLDNLVIPGAAADAAVEQSLARFRAAFAKDFRFKKMGEAGWFTHVAAGLGLDIGYERWEFMQVAGGLDTLSDNQTALGGGGGLLIGVYDDYESCKVNLGVAYSTEVDYDFNIDPDIHPQFDMPQQFNGGVTVYLLEKMRLRITADVQWIDWSETAPTPAAGQPGFEDALNISTGMEYRIETAKVNLFPRVGYRRFDAPWDDEDNLPAANAVSKLFLDTKAEKFNIFTFGLGISWSTESGKARTLDIGADVGGDELNVAIGFTLEL